jgi:hypothetical protein
MKGLDFGKIAVKTAGLAAGGVGAAVLNKHLPASINETLRPIIMIGVGALVPTFVKKNDLIGYVGDGMIARGASDLVSRFMPNLAGIGETEQYFFLPDANQSVVAGTEAATI